jgi:hypothetical protein
VGFTVKVTEGNENFLDLVPKAVADRFAGTEIHVDESSFRFIAED